MRKRLCYDEDSLFKNLMQMKRASFYKRLYLNKAEPGRQNASFKNRRGPCCIVEGWDERTV